MPIADLTSRAISKPLATILIRCCESLHQIVAAVDPGILLVGVGGVRARDSLDVALEIGIAEIAARVILAQFNPANGCFSRFHSRDAVSRGVHVHVAVWRLNHAVNGALDGIIAPPS